MTKIETPKVVKKKLFSPIWLLPIIALALGAWLGVKSIRESGIDVRIHFPSATGIDVGKTLVRYQGLTVGKVVDISIDDALQGVNVDLLMDYRSTPFLKDNTKFWLVTPKASITGVEGLDALFSGNYIAIQPGNGNERRKFIAEDQAPPVAPGSDGLMVQLSSPTLGSLDIGSLIFYRQIPVGKIFSYRLVNDNRILFNAYIQKQYTHLVKQNSQFWNVSGLAVDASLAGIKVKTESLSAILAGGVSFSSDPNGLQAEPNQHYTIFDDKDAAIRGVGFSLQASDADTIQSGASIVFRGIEIGRVTHTHLSDSGVIFDATFDSDYAHLLSGTAQFWVEGADISTAGIKHATRLLTGSVINFMPGTGEPLAQYPLLDSAPPLHNQPFTLTLTASENPGIDVGAQVRFKQLPIGSVSDVRFKPDYSGVEYSIDIWPEYQKLISSGSYFIPESALAIDASIEGVTVNTRDLATLTQGAISLIQGKSTTPVKQHSTLMLFSSQKQAQQIISQGDQRRITLMSPDGADLSATSPLYFKKMQIGQVLDVAWQAQSNNFAITLGVDKQFDSLLTPKTVFWRNNALTVDASLRGINVEIAPLSGAIKGSVSLGLLEGDDAVNSQHLYGSKALALAKATPITLSFPATTKLAAKAPIRYLGHQVGEIEQVKLNDDLGTVSVDAYLYGDYAKAFTRQDAQYFLIDAQISLSGIQAAETLLTGPYVAVLPGNSQQLSKHFTGLTETPVHVDDGSLQLTLIDSDLGSIKVGSPIIFRGIKIGEIAHYQLSVNGTQVQMQVQIDARYQHLVNQSSQFWDMSGIKVDVGLFSGAQIETGSLETILTGGIGVATQVVTTPANQLNSNQAFTLHEKPQTDWLNWAPNQRPNR